jgi:hypothetical protein
LGLATFDPKPDYANPARPAGFLFARAGRFIARSTHMHREFTSNAEIERIGRGVEDLTLPKPEWTHAAHFAAALWLLRRGEAARMPALIRAYNEATGVANTDTNGYHETITLASLRAADSVRVSYAAETSLHVVANALLHTEFGRSNWPLTYWTPTLLFSVKARREWVEPDLAPLSFSSNGPTL